MKKANIPLGHRKHRRNAVAGPQLGTNAAGYRVLGEMRPDGDTEPPAAGRGLVLQKDHRNSGFSLGMRWLREHMIRTSKIHKGTSQTAGKTFLLPAGTRTKRCQLKFNKGNSG